MLINIVVFFLLLFNWFAYFLLTKLNFNLLKINSIAISSVIIVRGLSDYLYVRINDDIAIFPRLDKWTTFRFFNTSFFHWSYNFSI